MKNMQAVKGMARFLTGTILEEMKAEYRKGKIAISAPKSRMISRQEFEALASYLKVSL